MGGPALTYMYIYIYNHNCLGRSAQTFGSVQISYLPLIIFTMYTVILRQILHSTILSSCLPCISSLCSSQCVLPASQILHCSFKMSSNSSYYYHSFKLSSTSLPLYLQRAPFPCSPAAAALLCSAPPKSFTSLSCALCLKREKAAWKKGLNFGHLLKLHHPPSFGQSGRFLDLLLRFPSTVPSRLAGWC